MVSSELETVWGSSWDSSTEKLRQMMIAFAERQREDLKAEWIAILKKGFGEDYNREYLPKSLAEERQKTPELPQTLETSIEGQISAEILKPSLGNFVEQVAGQKQKASMVESSTENPKLDVCNDDLELLKQNQDRFELEDAQIQNKKSKVTPECRLSDSILTRKRLGVRKITVKRRYHKARRKKSWGDDSVFQTKYTPRHDLVKAFKSYKMIGSSSFGDRLVNRKVERAHLKVKRSMVIRRIKYAKARKQVSLSFEVNGKIGSRYRSHDIFNPISPDDLMDSNRLATAITL